MAGRGQAGPHRQVQRQPRALRRGWPAPQWPPGTPAAPDRPLSPASPPTIGVRR